MIEELQQVDTSAIEELRKIKQDQEVLKDWLGKMEAKKSQVSDAVFARVSKDYQARNSALEDKARPLKDRARSEYAKLKASIERFEKALEVAKLDKEELEFRHEIGEFQGKEFDERLKEAEQRVSERQSDLAEADQLKQSFIQAFPSEQDLALPPPPAKPAPPAAAAAKPSLGPAATESFPAEPPGPKATHAAVPAAPQGEATIMIRKPHLLALLENGSTVEHPLELQVTTIGRAPDNRIRVQKEAVSRKHAEVVLGPKGYSIVDLKSENGTYVNGKRVGERLLAEGDTVQIGSQKFIFHEG
ncbi:MAG TPA: FHA domain-containing protein [Thermoanaerobaculaceae bacterium]|nr:FHA domain-containing protein [Thermoanaerobaculaceae bacterium]